MTMSMSHVLEEAAMSHGLALRRLPAAIGAGLACSLGAGGLVIMS